jgi:hypothetical protein
MLQHYLAIGYLDPSQVRVGKRVPARPLDPEIIHRLLRHYAEPWAEGSYLLGGHRVEFQDGYLVCPWLMPSTIRETEALALAVVRECGCIMADIGCRHIIKPEYLINKPTPEELDRLDQPG